MARGEAIRGFGSTVRAISSCGEPLNAEVVDFFRLSGDVDYLIRAVVPDIRAYDELYQRLIAKIDIYDVSSMFAMEQIKSTTELPLVYASTPNARGTSQTARHAIVAH